MARNRPRFALIGVLVLTVCVTVGLSAGAADGKKKKKGGKGGAVTVATTAATTLPPSVAAQPPGCIPIPGFPGSCTTPGRTSLTLVPLTVGKQAKGKVVSLNSVSVTYSLTGPPRSGVNPAAATGVALALTAPNGRTVALVTPGSGDANATNIGPVTETPNSPVTACVLVDSTGPTTTCTSNSDPDQAVGPPTWAGTIGNVALAQLGGVPAKGTWTVRARNTGTTSAATLSSVSLAIGLTPATKSGGKGKK